MLKTIILTRYWKTSTHRISHNTCLCNPSTTQCPFRDSKSFAQFCSAFSCHLFSLYCRCFQFRALSSTGGGQTVIQPSYRAEGVKRAAEVKLCLCVSEHIGSPHPSCSGSTREGLNAAVPTTRDRSWRCRQSQANHHYPCGRQRWKRWRRAVLFRGLTSRSRCLSVRRKTYMLLAQGRKAAILLSRIKACHCAILRALHPMPVAEH